MNIQQKIDKLGEIQAAIAELRTTEKALKADLVIAIPAGERMEGVLFGASHSESERATVAWKSIAAKLKASRQIITANTKHILVDTIKVTARETS